MTRRLLLLLLAVAFAAGAGVLLLEVADRARVDTAVAATAVGEPGCVTAARFTDPEGVTRTVDLRGYKGSCRDGDPGDRVTVYYRAGDPAVTAASLAWWKPALVTPAPATLALLAARAAVRRHADVLPERAFLDPDRPDAHLYYDHALGRIDALLDAVQAERTTVPRLSGATDGVLDGVQRELEAIRRCVLGSAVTAAEAHAVVLARLVLDAMAVDSRLAVDLLALRRQLSRRS